MIALSSLILEYHEIIWILFGFYYLWSESRRESSNFIQRDHFLLREPFFLLSIFLVKFAFTIHTPWANHVVAPAHIETASAGEIALILAIVRTWTHGEAPREFALSFLLQLACLILGMLWAFEDSGWGELWQWDRVESSALWVLWATSGGWRRPHEGRFWAWICLILAAAQAGLISGGALLSRHQYAERSWLPLACWILFAVAGLILSRKRKLRDEKVPQTRALCAGNLLLILGLWNALGGHCPVWAQMAAFIAVCVTGTFSRRTWILWVACILTMLAVHVRGAHERLVATTDSTSWQLAGVSLEPDESCYRYRFAIKHGDAIAIVPHTLCDGRVMHDSFADMREGIEFYRLRAMRYEAFRGLTLDVRTVTVEKWTSHWLIVFYFILFFHVNRSWRRPPRSRQITRVPQSKR